MGFFDLFRRRSFDDPNELRTALIDAAEDGQAFERLCAKHSPLIVEHYLSWATAPEEIRGQPAALQRYVTMLIQLAQRFAQAGHPELLQHLTRPGNNPITEVQAGLDQARAQMQAVDYSAARDTLVEQVKQLRSMTGSAADEYLPVALGMTGECQFQLAEAALAIEPTRQARDLCAAAGDEDGVLSYTRNLYEMHRYLGNGGEAATYADELAQLLLKGDPAQAQRLRDQASLVRAGEPLNRVVARIDETDYELDAMPSFEGRVQFIFVRNRLALHPCEQLVEQGSAEGQAGNYATAVDRFRAAAQADSFAPDPHYQLAFTLLHMGCYQDAVDAYDEADRLAPSWYHCRSDRTIALGLAEGTIEPPVFQLLCALEDGPMDAAEKLKLAQAGLQAAPELPLLHLHLGRQLYANGQPKEAERAYRAGLERCNEPATRTRLLVRLAQLLGPSAEHNELTAEAIQLGGDLVSAATARVLRRHAAQ